MTPTLLSRLAARLVDHVQHGGARDQPVVTLRSPDELAARFADAGVALPIGAREPGLDGQDEAIERAITTALEGSVRTHHPRFFNQNFAGADPIAVLGDWLIAAVNTTAATYEAAPVFTLMERAVVEAAAARFGWADGDAGYDGILGPGGSLSNTMALALARHERFPEAADEGQHTLPPLAIFTSAQSHYSLAKAASFLGFGRKALFKVACDDRGGMRPDALREAIAAARAQGREPLAINATAGTTVLGAFDPLEALADIAAEEKLWLHVDGCHGASVIFSARHRGLLDGVTRADSLAWNAHKMLGLTQQCSVCLVRRRDLLPRTFAAHANYLFQKDKNHAELDTGDKTVLCARRPDAAKLWLTWKVRGDAGFEARIDRAFALADYAAKQIDARPGFVWAAPRSFTHVCFWWVPPHLRPFGPADASDDARRTLHALAPRIKDRMQREGSAMVGYQPLGDLPNFFRLLVINPAVEERDIDAVFDAIEAYGADLS